MCEVCPSDACSSSEHEQGRAGRSVRDETLVPVRAEPISSDHQNLMAPRPGDNFWMFKTRQMATSTLLRSQRTGVRCRRRVAVRVAHLPGRDTDGSRKAPDVPIVDNIDSIIARKSVQNLTLETANVVQHRERSSVLPAHVPSQLPDDLAGERTPKRLIQCNTAQRNTSELLNTVQYLEVKASKATETHDELLERLSTASLLLQRRRSQSSSFKSSFGSDEVRKSENTGESRSQRSGSNRGPEPMPMTKVEEVSNACVVQHPGTLCCTTMTVGENEGDNVAMVQFSTTARCSKVEGSLATRELFVLAAQALTSSAQDLWRERWFELEAGLHSSTRVDRHTAIQRILERGSVVEATRNAPSEFGHESFLVTLQDPESDRQLEALFKPRTKGDAQGWHRVSMEWVAYRLNLLLGWDYVPPVGYRSGGVDVDYQHFEEGAFVFFSHGCRPLKDHPPEAWPEPAEVLLSNARILDVLLQNSDRHHGHLLVGEHWAEGGWDAAGRWRGEMRPVLIDHSAGFRPEAVVSMEHENAFRTGPVTRVCAQTYLRLRLLNASAASDRFAGMLSATERLQLQRRCSQVLEYLDELVSSQGYDQTVIQHSLHTAVPSASAR